MLRHFKLKVANKVERKAFYWLEIAMIEDDLKATVLLIMAIYLAYHQHWL